MAQNRLKLDFSLETAEERKNFLSTYLVQFDNLTQTELATLADYLLWGKDESGEAIGKGTGLKILVIFKFFFKYIPGNHIVSGKHLISIC